MDYVAMASMAQRLIDGSGREMTFRKLSTTPQNADKPWRGSTGPNVDSTQRAAMVEYKLKDVDGENVMRGDQMIIVGAGVDLKEFNQVLDGADTYKIIGVEVVKPGDTSVVHFIQARR